MIPDLPMSVRSMEPDLTGGSLTIVTRRFGPGFLSALVLSALLGGCAEAGESNAQPSQSRAATGDLESSELGCSRPEVEKVNGAPVVPSGAIAARLCGGSVDNGGFNLLWPADTLHGVYVDRLVRRLNELERYVEQNSCTLPYSPSFDLVLLYPDGSTVWAHGHTPGSCANFEVQGGDAWTGSVQVLRATQALIDDQRAKLGPAKSVARAKCPQSWNDVSYTAGADTIREGAEVSITVCRYRLEQGDPTTITQSWDGRLTARADVDDPETLMRAIAHGSKIDPCGGVAYDLERIQDILLVRDTYGDVQVASTTPCWPYDLTGPRLYPSAALAELTGHLLDRGAE
jgi:hypothetical protein